MKDTRSLGRVLGALALVLLAYGALEALLLYLWAMDGSHEPIASGDVAVCVMLGAIGLACLGYALVLIWRVWRDRRRRMVARSAK